MPSCYSLFTGPCDKFFWISHEDIHTDSAYSGFVDAHEAEIPLSIGVDPLYHVMLQSETSPRRSNIEEMKEAHFRSHGWTEVILEQLDGKNVDTVVMYALGTMGILLAL